MPSRSRPCLSVFALTLTVALAGCATAPTTPVTPILPAKAGIAGTVHGGQQAVSGATVQLWAVGTAGDGSPSTPLLSPAVVTDANGNFNITGLYVCPSASRLVYLTATGGNPGLTVGTNNSFLAMIAALGTCGSLSSSTYVTMNEVTTIGSVFALAPYMGSYSAIGYNASSPNSDLSAITSAFSEVNEFVNIATGVAGGTTIPSGYGVNVAQINTLADLLATCINSTGGTSPGQPCYNLDSFGYQTIQIAQEIAANPTNNLTTFFNEVPPSSPFQPQLSAAPSTWAISVEPIVATPTISPFGGTFTSTQYVTLADTTTNATIHYTVDGTTPTSTSATYSTALTVSTTETINAIATLSGDLDSSIASASFTINIPPNSGVITTIAGNGLTGYGSPYGYATSTALSDPESGAFDRQGNLYFIDLGADVVSEISSSVVQPYAGDGTTGYTGDGYFSTSAELNSPRSITYSIARDQYVSPATDLYMTDTFNHAIRAVSLSGAIYTIAGGNGYGFSGDGGQATNAKLNTPFGIALDSSGNIYISDTGNCRIRKVDTSGVITTFAGTGTYGYGGDGGQAKNAQLSSPGGLTFDSAGNLYIADTGSGTIRKITPGGVITTVAGVSGSSGYSGDGGPATSALLAGLQGVAVDSTGNIYISDRNNNRIRKVNPLGTITTFAGNGTSGFSGDGGQAASAELNHPDGVTVDSSDNVYIMDSGNQRIRKVNH